MRTNPKLTPWKKGPPPCVGWWIASCGRNDDARRYWNGEFWSFVVYRGDSDRMTRARKNARSAASGIEWRGLAEKPE